MFFYGDLKLLHCCFKVNGAIDSVFEKETNIVTNLMNV